MSVQSKKPDRKIIRQMLDDVEAVTKGRFYEDPEPFASPVEMFLIRDGRPGGESFGELSGREKSQVLYYYVRWQDYQDCGLTFKQVDQVFSNVIEGKPREQWLDGTGLSDQDRKKSLTEKKPHGKSETPPSRAGNAMMDDERKLLWMETIRRLDAAYMAGGMDALAKMNGIEIHVLYSEKMMELETVRNSLVEHGDNEISQLHKQKLEQQTTDMAAWMRKHCPDFRKLEQGASKTSLADLKAERQQKPPGRQKSREREMER